ncbi:hypothetical protein BC332_27670 [Capsicum chinense]|nr:hypothetical protein BC332_27670 [Capsicum chinense]
MLLKNKVFNTRSFPLVLEDVGQKIAQKCGGLPLSVVLVARILETIEKEKHSWEQVAINLGSHIQDEEIQVSKLTWLWIAEGLVKTHKEKLSEDIAENYLKNLIGKNLMMVSKKVLMVSPRHVAFMTCDNLSKWSSICSDVVKSKNGDVHHSNKEQDNENFILNKEMEQA